MKEKLPTIDSTKSDLTLEINSIDRVDSLEITENKRQSSDESTRSSEENIFMPDRKSLRFKTTEIFDKFSTKYHSDNSKAFNDLLSSFDDQLRNNLKLLLDQKKEGGFSGALYYELGAIYQKQYKVNEILGRNTEESNDNITKAISYFDKAIRYTPKTPENHNVLAKYHAHRAKGFYSRDENEDARTECLAAFAYNTKDYDAHEVMGYIHRSEGKYHLALSSFDQSSSNNKKDIHYVKALYNQSIVLAALGKQEEALLKFNLANSMPTGRLDLEDKLLAMAMRDPEYQNLIRDLVELSNEQASLDTPRNASINDIVNNIYPGSSSPTKIGGYSQKLSSLVQDLENKKTAHLNDNIKMRATLKKLESKEYGYIDKSERKQDVDLDTFYTEVKKLLIARYHAAEVISTEWVENGKTGDMGDVARTVSFIEEFIPVPKAFTLPMKITSVALENLDKYYQEESLRIFYDIADTEKEMKSLSKNIATRLTYLRKVSRENSDDNNIDFHTSKAEVKALAKSDAKNIVNFISDIIFAGRITADSIDEKANMIIALVKLDQDFKNDTIKELPVYAKDGAINTLAKMQGLAEHWHINKSLEETFTDRLANSIYRFKVPENFIKNDFFITNLARDLFNNDNVVTYVHRTVRFWEKKALLKEDFLSSENYFYCILRDVEKNFHELLDTATVASGEIDMSEHCDSLELTGDISDSVNV